MVTIVVIFVSLRLPPDCRRAATDRVSSVQMDVTADPPALRSPGHAAKGEPPSPSVSELFAVLFARRLVLVLLLAVMSLVPARANPMLLVDMDNFSVLYAQEAGQPWHPASLTKMMTAYVAFEHIAAGKVSLDTPVILSKRAINQ